MSVADRTVSPARSELIGVLVAASVTAVAFVNAVRLASKLAQTSDSAQGFVVGHAIASGNVLLSGWHFPIDNFYFTDSIPYAVAETISGPQVWLMAVVPALIYAGLVFLALVVSVRPPWSFGANVVPLAAITLLFSAPVWTGPWNPMLMSDMHMGSVVAAFAALWLFARLATTESDRAIDLFVAALAFLLAALTIASDPFSVVFAFGPAAAVLAIEAVRNPRLPAVRLVLLLVVATILAGLLLPGVIASIGGFTTENDLAFGFAPLARWWMNLIAVVFGIFTLWGVNPPTVHSLPDVAMLVIRSAALALVLFALAHVGRSLVRGGKLDLLGKLLCAGAAVSLAACIPSAQFAKGVRPENMWHGGPPMRFLVPAVLFASILACREVAGALEFSTYPGFRVRLRRGLTAFAGLVLLMGILQSALSGLPPQGTNNVAEVIVARWLAQQRFSQGAGEYWSANLLTAMSGNAIAVRSMVPDHGRLVPYVWAESQAFYAKPPQFGVWREPNQTGWTETLVRATWRVCAMKIVAGYHIAVLQTSRDLGTCSPS